MAPAACAEWRRPLWPPQEPHCLGRRHICSIHVQQFLLRVLSCRRCRPATAVAALQPGAVLGGGMRPTSRKH